jgi:hypothetical protein
MIISNIFMKGETPMANQNLAQALQYRDATRSQARACIGISGMSGTGKSGLALAIGYILADKDWQKEFVVDTENKSLDLFQGLQLHTGDTITPFKKVDLLPSYGYAPSNYLLCKENAINAGASVWIADSASHMWTMEGGVLQRVSELEKANAKLNKFNAWGTDEVVSEKNGIFKVIRDNRIHVISTIRTKRKYTQGTDDKGKPTIIALGEQDMFMPDIDFEFDLLLRMVSPGGIDGAPPVAEVIKTRYVIFKKGETYQFTESLLMQLKAYLQEGADPALLQEQQRQELILATKNILDSNQSKATMFPVLKEQIGVKDIPLVDLPLDTIRTLFGILIN